MSSIKNIKSLCNFVNITVFCSLFLSSYNTAHICIINKLGYFDIGDRGFSWFWLSLAVFFSVLSIGSTLDGAPNDVKLYIRPVILLPMWFSYCGINSLISWYFFENDRIKSSLLAGGLFSCPISYSTLQQTFKEVAKSVSINNIEKETLDQIIVFLFKFFSYSYIKLYWDKGLDTDVRCDFFSDVLKPFNREKNIRTAFGEKYRVLNRQTHNFMKFASKYFFNNEHDSTNFFQDPTILLFRNWENDQDFKELKDTIQKMDRDRLDPKVIKLCYSFCLMINQVEGTLSSHWKDRSKFGIPCNWCGTLIAKLRSKLYYS